MRRNLLYEQVGSWRPSYGPKETPEEAAVRQEAQRRLVNRRLLKDWAEFEAQQEKPYTGPAIRTGLYAWAA